MIAIFLKLIVILLKCSMNKALTCECKRGECYLTMCTMTYEPSLKFVLQFTYYLVETRLAICSNKRA